MPIGKVNYAARKHGKAAGLECTISAIDSVMAHMHIQQTRTNQMAPAVPPFERDKMDVTIENSQVSPRTMT